MGLKRCEQKNEYVEVKRWRGAKMERGRDKRGRVGMKGHVWNTSGYI